jgi:hypothetical protein
LFTTGLAKEEFSPKVSCFYSPNWHFISSVLHKNLVRFPFKSILHARQTAPSREYIGGDQSYFAVVLFDLFLPPLSSTETVKMVSSPPSLYLSTLCEGVTCTPICATKGARVNSNRTTAKKPWLSSLLLFRGRSAPFQRPNSRT